MDKNALTVTVTIDTVYGFINKYGYCKLKPIEHKHVLESYLKKTFSELERAILQEFEEMENQNRVEVTNDMENNGNKKTAVQIEVKRDYDFGEYLNRERKLMQEFKERIFGKDNEQQLTESNNNKREQNGRQ